MVHYIYPPIAKNSLFDEIASEQIVRDYGSDAPMKLRKNHDSYVGLNSYHNYFPVVDSLDDDEIEELTK